MNQRGFDPAQNYVLSICAISVNDVSLCGFNGQFSMQVAELWSRSNIFHSDRCKWWRPFGTEGYFSTDCQSRESVMSDRRSKLI